MSGTKVISANNSNIQSLLSIASSLSPEEAQDFLGCLDTLSKSGLPNLSPLLKYILFLKGKPYTLERHFHFEPIFNTFLPNTMTLKTGRQVSKCVAGDNDPLLYNANGRPIGFNEISVGDTVWSVDNHGHIVSGRVVGLHKQVASEVYKLVTSTGSWCTVTAHHKLLTDLGYKEANLIVPKDKVGVVGRGKGFGAIGALSANSAMLAGSAFYARDYSCHPSSHRLGAGLFNLPYVALQKAVGSVLEKYARCYSGILKISAPSKMWIEDLRALLWKLGVPSSVSYSKGETILSFDTENSVSAVEGVFPKLSSYFGISSTCFKDKRLEETCDLMWDPVVSCERLSSVETTDIEIETHHNYILNGMVSHNSTSLASQGIILSATLPYFTTLYITPLYEMIRRFSNNYVKDFIDQSPIKGMLLSGVGQSNVLQRSFYNSSKMIFSFAFLDCSRIRGVSANRVCIDEIQNLDETFLPIIYETMSAADTPLAMNAGTPLSMDNTLQKVWEESSQAEWIIRCPRCHYDNVPAMGYDIDNMIGPAVESISPDRPGLQCAKCKRPMKATNGRWVHKYKDRRFRHAGYHVPQIIMPMHYNSYDKWSLLCAKREGSMNTTIGQFYNEVLGESYDTGAKLVTETELRNVSVLGENSIEHAKTLLNRYSMRVLGIDWGGGGSKGTSFTAYAVLGFCADGSGIDCIFGYRSLTPHDHKLEAKYAIQFAKELQCDFIAHDFGGAGNFREEYIISAGFPVERVAPISYIRASSQACMRHIPASDVLPRDTYRLDKTRSLVSLCYEIKANRIRFFNYDYKSQEYKGLIYDFLALAEEKTDTRTSNDLYTIIRKQNQSDDFAHAVNMGASLLYHINDAWPRAAVSDKYRYQNFEFTDLGHDASDF